MNTEQDRAKSIFLNASEIGSDALRRAYIAEQCGQDDSLRGEVEDLLRHENEAGSFLESAAAATLQVPVPAERPGVMVNRYKLLEQIGEGGFGTVFMAEQSHPVQRQVAVKIIKAGMDSRQVIARFEAERQALALMDHPNIARVLDAGTTETGRPFFVMELVKGVPLTEYCDQHHLTPRERLELFMQVCQAVQHAHHKGIIHRDLKPSNVLVALYDEKPVPKVIDFGVAKATGAKLTERTLFTEFGSLVGTVEYMSPEQAGLNQLDIDTRSDIYSLGVLLYELLTGTTPLERKRLKTAAMLELLRLVREEEAPRPSTRLGTTEQFASISANRGLEPKKLNGLLRGELDWIVMKALDKDRNRRYETANALGADVQRYLTDEAVQACPPSAGYRFRKFARRNKVALAVGAVVLFSLLLAASGIGWAFRDRAVRQARVSGQLELILDEVGRLQRAEKWAEALACAQRAEPALAAADAPRDIDIRIRQTLADLRLVQQLDEIRARSGTTWGLVDYVAWADQQYTTALRQFGIDVDALPQQEAVDRILAHQPIAAALLPALDDWVTVRSMGKDEAAARRLIDVLRTADRDPWRQRMRDALARKDWPALENLLKSPDLDRQPAATLSFLASALQASGKVTERLLVLTRAQRKYPADYWINHALGVIIIFGQSPGDLRDGVGYMRAAVALRPESAHSLMNLGVGYAYLGQHDDSIACCRKAVELQPTNWACHTNLGNALYRVGLYEEAIAAWQHAIEVAPREPLPHNNIAWYLANSPDLKHRDPGAAMKIAKIAIELSPNDGQYWNTLGIAHYRAGDWRAAIEALNKSEGLPSPRPSTTCFNAFLLTMANWQLGGQHEARQWHAKAVDRMEKQHTNDEELRRFRAEAEELLNVTKELPTTKSESK